MRWHARAVLSARAEWSVGKGAVAETLAGRLAVSARLQAFSTCTAWQELAFCKCSAADTQPFMPDSTDWWPS